MLGWFEVPSSHLLPETSGASITTLSVLTLYSESVAAEYERFTAFLHDLLGRGAELCGTALKFGDFEAASGRLAESEASDVVVLITGDQELPIVLRQWMARWLNQAHVDSAVICLLADGIDCQSATWHGVHRACDEAGVAFFATGFKSDAVARLPVHKPAPRAQEFYSSGILHGGIND